MATIYQNERDNENVRANFPMHELRSNSWDAPDTWELSDTTLDALQEIRNEFGSTTPTSTGRTDRHSASIGSGSYSMHSINKNRPVHAIDFKINDPAQEARFQDDIEAKGPFFQRLRRKYGITIGLYDSFTAHIDSGNGAGVNAKSIQHDAYGRFGYWDNRLKKKD